MNEENNPFGAGFAPSIGTGEGEVPLAKQPVDKVDVRTMSSDISSLKETGGTMPRPYEASGSKTPNNSTDANKVGLPETPQTPKAPSPTGPVFSSNFETKNSAQNQEWKPSPSAVIQKTKKGSVLFKWILTIVIIAGVVAAVYFFVAPRIKEPSKTISENNIAAPEAALPETEVAAPVGETNSAPEEAIPAALPGGATLEIHSSLFKNPTDLILDTKLSAFALVDFISALEFTSTSVPIFKEVVFKTQENKPLSFSYVAGVFLPSFFTEEMVNNFENDGTFFSYTNKDGTWFGAVSKLKDSVLIGSVQDSMSTLQKSPDIKNFFLSDPGDAGEWKDGKVANKPTSLVSFSLSGAVFSYTWFDKYLLIGSNLDSSNEAAKRLGY
ncbi:hypothetical protein A3I34_00395 [Candidatus Jorgensenbacteria bacterium RIFCSPLOWO2_02_FULL_45_12]|uniref:Uncharacterized protein n=2 Tax=Candidatus Joergenseniibacteriota TaxID=1752739 RepID=A0A1F6BPP6_9BACT|nr:MAG: hypothetical protein UX22_C0006G0021 [Candidatus Jorgensenbacteria bacterium GW2011_GWA2_45_9]OGG38895.1 MAG: hypothetical protein A3D55_02755 [Candidatus Jorgensenbacteria bacterium RIFCSPHIGHO2_02_FULL_45_20]OGG42379.1 MAG: hypothetical protein A3I34_00395 [Candidatus Jorgensenbacteria bacterium RIFCSPLOWO2_02_FULL_45_12]